MAMSTGGMVPSSRVFALVNLIVQRAPRSLWTQFGGLLERPAAAAFSGAVGRPFARSSKPDRHSALGQAEYRAVHDARAADSLSVLPSPPVRNSL
jgi:hypothetical protein